MIDYIPYGDGVKLTYIPEKYSSRWEQASGASIRLHGIKRIHYLFDDGEEEKLAYRFEEVES